MSLPDTPTLCPGSLRDSRDIHRRPLTRWSATHFLSLMTTSRATRQRILRYTYQYQHFIRPFSAHQGV